MIFNRSIGFGYLAETPVRRLKDKHDLGYASFGYGGDHLFIVYEANCFMPALYVVRADNVSEAYDVAVNCLCSVVDREDYGEYGIFTTDDAPLGAHWQNDAPIGADWRSDGELVDTDHLMIVGPLSRRERTTSCLTELYKASLKNRTKE